MKKSFLLVEVAVSLATAFVFFLSCLHIRIKALARIGQVSGEASLGLRFVVASIVLVGLLIIAARWRSGRYFERATTLVCASAAGLFSGLLAGGILVALHGTPFGLGADRGDSGMLAYWAEQLKHGGDVSPVYPPLQMYLIKWISQLYGTSTFYAVKQFQQLSHLIVGPLAYVSWRLLLRPAWALGIGVTIALPLAEPYRLYPFLVLIAFLPVAIRFLEQLRDSAQTSPGVLARNGAIYGAVLAVMFLTYSGWFQWSAPGFVAIAAWVFPWRTAPRRGALLCAVALAVFVIVSLKYLLGLAAAPPIHDDYVYFENFVQPAYITMWKGSMPGAAKDLWPPVGELGGVGVFTTLLAAGFAAAVALGRRELFVVTPAVLMTSAWLLRFWYAHSMWDTGLVQLYPRTTAQILYCLLALAGLAVWLGYKRLARPVPPAAVIGAVCGLLFIYLQSGIAISDRYMAKNDESETGFLAYTALDTPLLDRTQTRGATLSPASSLENDTYSFMSLIDGKPGTEYSSELRDTADHEEAVEVHFPGKRDFSRVVLTPARDGWPVDYVIEVWDGATWIPRITRHDEHAPDKPVVIPLGRHEDTTQVRIRATKLGAVAGGKFALRLGELEIYRD